MALYLIRAGRNGEFENRFIDENRVYLHWGDLFADRNIAQIGDYDALKQAALAEAPDEKPKAIINGVSQINTFVHRIAQGDWVVLPLKHNSAIAVGKIISAYTFNISNDEGFRHYRDIEWLNSEIPRSVFDQDLLYSFGAFMTVCQVQRNDAENRLKALASANWQRSTVTVTPSEGIQETAMEAEDFPDYEVLAVEHCQDCHGISREGIHQNVVLMRYQFTCSLPHVPACPFPGRTGEARPAS